MAVYGCSFIRYSRQAPGCKRLAENRGNALSDKASVITQVIPQLSGCGVWFLRRGRTMRKVKRSRAVAADFSKAVARGDEVMPQVRRTLRSIAGAQLPSIRL
jgi:hypothetical protein